MITAPGDFIVLWSLSFLLAATAFCLPILIVYYFVRLFLLLLSFKLLESDDLSVYLYVYHMELHVFTYGGNMWFCL